MKAVLVIDMPKSCFDCQLMVDGWCYAVKADRTQETISAKDRTCWCPLRPLPQKMTMEKALKMERVGAIKDIYTTWNACLDEIVGETE